MVENADAEQSGNGVDFVAWLDSDAVVAYMNYRLDIARCLSGYRLLTFLFLGCRLSVTSLSPERPIIFFVYHERTPRHSDK